MPVWVAPAFVACALVSLVASQRLVKALECLGDAWGAPQVLLGLIAAVAADGPELSSSLAAQFGGQRTLGVGVLFGSNVFNIAALLGVGAMAAGSVSFHRRAVVLEGVAAVGVAAASLLLVWRAVPVAAGGALAAMFFVPYLVVAAVPTRRLPFPRAARTWLAMAVREEGEDLAGGYPRSEGPSVRRELLTALAASALVVGASALMEHSASVGGTALGLSPIVVGGVVLAAVTSLPNAVAAVHLARAGKGAAMLSEAMNSNTINVMGGLVLPAVVVGLGAGAMSGGTQLAAGAYMAMTVAALAVGFAGRGMTSRVGALLVLAYVGFLAVLVST